MYNLVFHEQKQHGTIEFPAEYYYITQEHPRYHMVFHWHKEWEIIRILKGYFLLHLDGQEYHAQAGDVFLVRDGMLHGGIPQDCVYECFVFDLHGLFRDINSVKKYLRPIYRNVLLPQVFFPNRQADIYPIVDELMGEFSPSLERSYPELATLGSISRLFTVILRKGYVVETEAPQQDNSRKVAQLKAVLEYIETHFNNQLTLDTLAGVAGMSPKYFCRFFRTITQQTPMDYVNYYRIEQAARLLSSADWSVTAVGLECGFNDSSYFVKAFKKYKGITPKQYQKMNV